MKREIKFRGFNISWVYGGLSIFENEAKIFDINCIVNSAYEVDIKSVGQFTGLLDKNGVEIYEGDIVIYDRGIGNWTEERISTTHEIVFNDEVFAFVMKYGSSYIKLRKHWNYTYEVTGNIHQNPELL